MKFINIKNDELIQGFLLGKNPTNKGLYITDIWAMEDNELERSHDYIQWIFPLQEKSMYNFKAPVIKDPRFMHDIKIRENLIKSLIVMLSFWGFTCTETGEIVKSDNFDEKSKRWLKRHNHNYLRITRVLKSLIIAGLDVEANLFFAALSNVYRENSSIIGEETYHYWADALNTPCRFPDFADSLPLK